MHRRNFVAQRAGVNRHGAILGMQMQCNRASVVKGGPMTGSASNPEISIHYCEIPGSPLGAVPE